MMKPALIKPWLYKLLPVVIWFLLLVLPFATSTPPLNVTRQMHQRFLYNVFISNALLLIIFYVHTFWLYPILQKKSWGLYLLMLAVLIGAYFLYWNFTMTEPPNVARFVPRDGEQPRFAGMRPRIPFMSPLIALLCSFCYRVILDDATREQDMKDRETVHLRTELSFLRSQISPHFMFNVLNSLVSLSRKKSDALEPAIVDLSQLMRYMLYETDDNSVPLRKEIAYLDSYINLQKLRFGKTINVQLEVQGDPGPYSIEPMLLIPFVENAFKHGAGSEDAAVILVMLQIDAHDKTLRFRVVNTVNADNNSKDANRGIGLTNVRRRLAILYPDRHRLRLDDGDNVFTAALTIQLD